MTTEEAAAMMIWLPMVVVMALGLASEMGIVLLSIIRAVVSRDIGAPDTVAAGPPGVSVVSAT